MTAGGSVFSLADAQIMDFLGPRKVALRGCDEKLPRADLRRPMAEVLEGRGGADGQCLFAPEGTWLADCAISRQNRDYLLNAMRASNMLRSVTKEDPPLGFQGDGYRTDYQALAQESSYCFQNGWLDQSRFPREGVRNATLMGQLARQECKKLRREIPDLDQWSWHDFELRGWFSHSRTTMRNHAAWKCALSGLNDGGGLECDIGTCMYLMCGLSNNFVGHGRQCQEDWMPLKDVERYKKALATD